MDRLVVLEAEAVSAEELTTALRRLLTKGLPSSAVVAGSVLPNLKNVVARSVHPDVALSRLDALNELLPRLLDTMKDEQYAEAARMLFGVATGTRRTTLTARRRQAAYQMGYHVDHFRSRVESELVQAVAELLLRDLLRYKGRVKRASGALEPTGDTPRLTVEDLTAEEELVSRIWSRVYGLRAELIAHLRFQDQAGYAGQAEDHRQAAEREQEALRELIGEYVGTYGKRLIAHGEAEYAVEGLERLAGWRA